MPSTGYAGAASFTYTITNRHAGSASASVTLTVSIPPPSLFSASAGPTQVNSNDNALVQLGVKFQSSVAGTIMGIRF
jgi:hypothetical protein